jgi:hypothetical protein
MPPYKVHSPWLPGIGNCTPLLVYFSFFLSHLNRPGWLWSPLRLLFSGYRGIFRGSDGRSAKLTTHVHLMQRFKRSGAVHVLNQNVCMTKTRTTSPLRCFFLAPAIGALSFKREDKFRTRKNSRWNVYKVRKASRLQCLRVVSKELPFAYKPLEWWSPNRISPAALIW